MMNTQTSPFPMSGHPAAWLFALVATLVLASVADAQSHIPYARDSSFNTGWRFTREDASGGLAVTDWRWAPADPKQVSYQNLALWMNGGPPAPDSPSWQHYALGSDVLQGKKGVTWFQTTLPATPGPDRLGLVTRLDLNPPSMQTVDAQLLKGIKQADDNWLIYLNGDYIARQSGNSGQFTLDLNQSWHRDGPNVLTILVDNVSAMEGGLSDVRIADRAAPTQMNIGYDDGAWEQVTLPHTPKIETYNEYFPWRGLCWYRKTITPQASWIGRRVSVEFQGAMQVSYVWVNGEHRTTHYGGFLPFTVDLSKDITPGKKIVIALCLDNRDNGLVPPGKPLRDADFEYFGGLYRDAVLHVTGPLHITDVVAADKVAGGGVFVTFPQADASSATVHVQTDVRNDFVIGKNASVQVSLTDSAGKVVADSHSEAVVIDGGASRVIAQDMRVPSPHLWSPDHPNLYRIHVTVKDGARSADEENFLIGIRRFEFSTKTGFSINGQHLFLHGANRHQYYPWIGDALSDNEQYRDLQRIKEAGWNAVRLCHYPQSPQVMDACDRLGIVALVCCPGWQWYSGDPVFVNRVDQADREMVRWHRNHASAMLWEVTLNETYAPLDKVKDWAAAIRQELPGDQCFISGDTKDYGDPHDIGFDAPYPGWNGENAPAGADTSRMRFFREYGANAQADRNDGDANMVNQTRVAEETFDNVIKESYYMAATRWSYMDYVRGYASIPLFSGAVSIDRIPKFLYEFHRSQTSPTLVSPLYASGPMVFIANYWMSNSPKDITVFSNCDHVELFVNGVSVGKKGPDTDASIAAIRHPSFTFPGVTYAPGTLKAVGYLGGDAVATTTVSTPGKPVALKLVAEEFGRPLTADGADVVFVRAEVVDAAGTLVPDGLASVHFSTSGDGLIVGDNPRVTGAGISSCLLRAGFQPGPITVTATADGLTAATLVVHSVKPDPVLRAWR